MSEANEKPIVNVEGERIALGPLRRDLAPTYRRWMNDFSTIRTLGRIARPVTEEDQAAWLDRVLSATETDRLFTIWERSTWRPIGVSGLNDIELVNGKASFGIVIGEADARGHGNGTEATRLMLDYAFTVLGLHNVMLTVYPFNPGGVRAYEKAGFRVIGRRRGSRRQAGTRQDEILMDAIASEFESPVLAKTFRP